MNTSIYSGPLTVVSNMDENIDSNYEDNVFSHVAAKICGLNDLHSPSREKKAKRSSNKAFKWSNSYKVGENMQITHKFACSICGRVYASQRSIKAHIKYHENLSFLQDKDGQNVEPFNVVEAEEGMWKKTYVVKFHKAVLCFCALDYEQDTDLYPDETAGETATRSTRVNTPRGINSTKGRSAAVLTDRSQRNPSPTECSLPRSVWGSQPLPRDNYGLSSNINEAITTSQEGNFSNPSTNAEQTTTMSESTNLERKESFDPNNFWDESYPSYHSSNNEDFFKRTYLHQPNEQIDPSYPLYIPQDGESNTGFGIFSELPQIRTDTAIVQ